MSNYDVSARPAGPRPVGSIARFARAALWALASAFVGCIVLQFSFAGLAALASPRYWALHSTFGNSIAPLALLVPLVALLARLPWRLMLLSALTFVMFAFQFVALYLLPRTGIVELRALHALNALVLLWIGLTVARGAWRLWRPIISAPKRLGPGDELPG